MTHREFEKQNIRRQMAPTFSKQSRHPPTKNKTMTLIANCKLLESDMHDLVRFGAASHRFCYTAVACRGGRVPQSNHKNYTFCIQIAKYAQAQRVSEEKSKMEVHLGAIQDIRTLPFTHMLPPLSTFPTYSRRN